MTSEWAQRFLLLCEHIAQWSKDPSTKVGCVIVDCDKRVVSMGFNGFPRGVEDTPERYTNREVKYKMVRHAEANAISFANRRLDGCTLFSMYFPCAQCAGAIIQSGITDVIVRVPTVDYLSRWKDEVDLAATMFQEAHVNFWLLSESGYLETLTI